MTMLNVKEPVTPAELEALPRERPEGAGEYWAELPHHALLAGLRGALAARSLEAGEPVAALNPDRRDMAAAVPLAVSVEGMPAWVGLVNSNARRFALRAYLGVTTGEGAGLPLLQLLRQRHSLGMGDVPERIAAKVRPGLAGMPAVVRRLKGRLLEAGERDRLLLRAAREGLITWTRLGRAAALFSAREQTCWELLACLALAGQIAPPLDQLPNNHGMRRIMPV
jgi:hypothetical protein